MNQEKTTLMRLIEERRGRPIEVIIAELTERYELVEEIAAELGIQESTAYKWLVQFGFERRWVKPERAGEKVRVS